MFFVPDYNLDEPDYHFRGPDSDDEPESEPIDEDDYFEEED